MIKSKQRTMRITAAAVTAGAIACAGALAAAGTAQAAPAHADGQKVTTRAWLAPMPEGTVTLGRDASGAVDATVHAFGLTPGSSHAVGLVNRHGKLVTFFGTLTADSAGQAWATLDSAARHLAPDAHVVMLNGTAANPVSAEPIALTVADHNGFGAYRLIPVEVSAAGTDFGVPQGSATISYNPFARTISVTVNASGLTPGAHAAHLHVGSCAAQGPVKYMLTDFIADASGRIVNETRTVRHVTTPLPASGWYLNLHQGNGNEILDAAGNPTVSFRPLLCGDIAR